METKSLKPKAKNQNSKFKNTAEPFQNFKLSALTFTFIFVIDVFSIMASACVCPPLPPCYRKTSGWPTCGRVWNCSAGQTCCNGSCCGGNCQSCVSGSCVVCNNDPNKFCCNNSCCSIPNCQTCGASGCESICDPNLCQTCNGSGSCITCGGDPNKFCCGGSCGDSDANEACCDNKTIYDTDTKQCCGEGTGHTCDKECESCCNGNCCDISNCEICKSGTCVRAVPTNMHQTNVEDMGNGVLHFEYAWESTTGDLADLGNCSVREKVDYPGSDPYYWPSPPWYNSTPNPTIAPNPPISATYGVGADNHSPGSFTTPYQAASFTATQVYQYHCGPACCMADDSWETLLDIGAISRFVTEGGGLWRYSITKSGAYAEILPLP